MSPYRTAPTRKRTILWVMTALTIVPVARTDQAPSSTGEPLSRQIKGPMWSLVAPGGGTATVSDGHLRLTASPAGDGTLTGTNKFVRLLQPIADVDFDISIKIDSAMEGQEAEQGVMMATDEQTCLTLEMTRNVASVRLSAHSLSDDVSITLWDGVTFLPESPSIYLRLQRERAEYRAYYSKDGETWTLAAGFHYAPIPAFIGPFIGPSNGPSSGPSTGYDRVTPGAVPAVMSVDWFKVRE